MGIYAGLGCVDAGPVAGGRRRAAAGSGRHVGQRQGDIPDHHPLAVGWGYGKQGTRAAEAAFKEVDLVLAVGVRYSEVSTANYAIPQHDVLIHVDVNPQNLGRNVPAHVAVCSDSRVFLDRLLADGDAVRRAPCPQLWQHIQDLRQVDRCEAATVRIHPCVDPMFFLSRLRAALGPDELIFVDVTAATHWASETVEVPGPRRYFTPADNQSMGWAIPAAIGAQRVRPDRQVVCVTGDGCFLMSAIETSTAARAGLPVKFFVLDDGAYHYMQMLQEPVYRRTTATEIARIDFAAFAQSMGLAFNQITDNADALAGIQRALATPAPSSPASSSATKDASCVAERPARAVRQKAPKQQKVRLAARIGVRALTPQSDSD